MDIVILGTASLIFWIFLIKFFFFNSKAYTPIDNSFVRKSGWEGVKQFNKQSDYLYRAKSIYEYMLKHNKSYLTYDECTKATNYVGVVGIMLSLLRDYGFVNEDGWKNYETGKDTRQYTMTNEYKIWYHAGCEGEWFNPKESNNY